MTQAATLRARVDPIRDGRGNSPKPAGKRIGAVTPRPENSVDTEYRPIPPSDEPAIQLVMALLQGKWRIAILLQLQNGPVRLSELRRRLSPVSKKVLNQHLHQMEKGGLIVRSDLSGKVPHVEYRLANPLGFAALTLLQNVARWGAENVPQFRAGKKCPATPGSRKRAQEGHSSQKSEAIYRFVSAGALGADLCAPVE